MSRNISELYQNKIIISACNNYLQADYFLNFPIGSQFILGRFKIRKHLTKVV